jgi:hypothetical protein
VEQVGLPVPDLLYQRKEAQRRLALLQPQAQRLA